MLTALIHHHLHISSPVTRKTSSGIKFLMGFSNGSCHFSLLVHLMSIWACAINWWWCSGLSSHLSIMWHTICHVMPVLKGLCVVLLQKKKKTELRTRELQPSFCTGGWMFACFYYFFVCFFSWRLNLFQSNNAASNKFDWTNWWVKKTSQREHLCKC